MTAITTQNCIFLSSGNSAQLRQAKCLFESIRSIYTGAKVIFLSDNLQPEEAKDLEQLGVEVKIYSNSINFEKNELKNSRHPFGKLGKPFLIRCLIASELSDYLGLIIYTDPDVIFQRPFSLPESWDGSGLLLAAEYQRTDQLPVAVLRLRLAIDAGLLSKEDSESVGEEINTGVIAFFPKTGVSGIENWCSLILNPQWKVFCEVTTPGLAWHDQDYFRALVRSNRRRGVALFDYGQVAHLNGSAAENYRYSLSTGRFLKKNTLEVPAIVHFAGGASDRYIWSSIRYRTPIRLLKYWLRNLRARIRSLR